jgi:RNA polymerase sigma factor (TIGR02999 family)
LEPTLSSLLEAAQRGDHSATEALFSNLYSQLHRLAKRELLKRGFGISLSATALLHEAYLDMASRAGVNFPDQGRFMGYAARVMRGLIIDYARNRSAVKRGGKFEITSMGTETIENPADERELTLINDALEKLSQEEPSAAQIVDLKFFCGFSFIEIAAMQNLSERTVRRKWEKARIFLRRELRDEVVL